MAKFIPETESLRESIYALFAALPDPSHFARVLLLFVARERSIAPFGTCIFSIFSIFFFFFFFFWNNSAHWKNSRTTIVIYDYKKELWNDGNRKELNL